jgi:hypothetical protein
LTPRRAWALIILAGAALAATPFAAAACSIGIASLAALAGMAALHARDTMREDRLKRIEQAHADFLIAAKVDAQRTGEMWRAYQEGR